MFYGAVVRSGKPTAYVPPPDELQLHLSQASLPADVKKGTRASLYVKVQDEEPICICTLTAAKLDSVPLDLFLDSYAEFSVRGESEVHITGYFSADMGPPSDMEDEDEDGMYPMDMFGGDLGDEDEEEDDNDSSDEDEDEESSDDDGTRLALFDRRVAHKPSAVIEDITDQEPATNGNKATAAQSNGKSGKGKAATPQATNVIESEEEDEDEDEEDSEEEEEPTPPPVKGGKGKAAAAEASGKKRKAEEALTQSSKKQAATPKKEDVAKTPQPQASADKKKQQQQQGMKQEPKTPQQQKQQQQASADKNQPSTSKQVKKEEDKAEPVDVKKKNIRRWENGFEIEELKMGPPHGKLAKAGKKVMVKYVGKLKSNGKVFDKSGGKPFGFRLGVGEVIKGWDAGVEGMRVGDKRRLTIPPQMAYGSQGAGRDIPPNATLVFEVELVDVK